MSSSPVHQIYATHCTYGSSAIERRTGELADRVLGYSARASSLPVQQLRKHIRSIERYLSYHLPADAPSELKLQWTCETSPKKLVFVSSVSGLQMLAQVSYRQLDTANRPGSYFAHILMSERQPGVPPWSISECLKLWGNPNWLEEDSPSIPYDLAPLESLQQFRDDHAPFIDEERFLSFMTQDDPPGFAANTPGLQRWLSLPAEQRKQLFGIALRGYLQVAEKQRETALLVVEPDIAAILFYGTARLLPNSVTNDRLSFSTYEAIVERRPTTLSATHFCDSSVTDIKPELYNNGFALNTFTTKASTIADSCYVPFILSRFQNGWLAVDQTLGMFQSVEVRNVDDLEALAKADVIASDLLNISGSLPPLNELRNSPIAVKFLRERLMKELLNDPSPEFIDRVGNSGKHLFTVLWLLCNPSIPTECQTTVDVLLTRIPPPAFASFLKLGIPDSIKMQALKNQVSRYRQLPPGLDGFWIRTAGDSQRSLAAQLLESIPDDVHLDLWNRLKDDEWIDFLILTSLTSGENHESDQWCAEQIGNLSETDLRKLLSAYRDNKFVLNGQARKKFFDGIHRQIVEQHRDIPNIYANLADFSLLREQLTPEYQHRLDAWQSLVSYIETAAKTLIQQQTVTQQKHGFKRLDPERVGEEVARKFLVAMGVKRSTKWITSDETKIYAQLLTRLEQVVSPKTQVLPIDLESKLGFFFEYECWPDDYSSAREKLRSRKVASRKSKTTTLGLRNARVYGTCLIAGVLLITLSLTWKHLPSSTARQPSGNSQPTRAAASDTHSKEIEKTKSVEAVSSSSSNSRSPRGGSPLNTDKGQVGQQPGAEDSPIAAPSIADNNNSDVGASAPSPNEPQSQLSQESVTSRTVDNQTPATSDAATENKSPAEQAVSNDTAGHVEERQIQIAVPPYESADNEKDRFQKIVDFDMSQEVKSVTLLSSNEEVHIGPLPSPELGFSVVADPTIPSWRIYYTRQRDKPVCLGEFRRANAAFGFVYENKKLDSVSDLQKCVIKIELVPEELEYYSFADCESDRFNGGFQRDKDGSFYVKLNHFEEGQFGEIEMTIDNVTFKSKQPHLLSRNRKLSLVNESNASQTVVLALKVPKDSDLGSFNPFELRVSSGVLMVGTNVKLIATQFRVLKDNNVEVRDPISKYFVGFKSDELR